MKLSIDKRIGLLAAKLSPPEADHLLRSWSYHRMQHTEAELSLLLAHGVPMKIVQEIMGHSNFQITMDTYSHVLPSALTDAVETMNRIFSKGDDEVVALVVAPVEPITIQ